MQAQHSWCSGGGVSKKVISYYLHNEFVEQCMLDKGPQNFLHHSTFWKHNSIQKNKLMWHIKWNTSASVYFSACIVDSTNMTLFR